MSPATMAIRMTRHHIVGDQPDIHRNRIQLTSRLPELTEPVLKPMKRLYRKKTSASDIEKIILSLKSGLLAETTWSLDSLNMILRDDSCVNLCRLSNMPGLMNTLVDHWRDAVERLHSFVGVKEESSYTCIQNNKNLRNLKVTIMECETSHQVEFCTSTDDEPDGSIELNEAEGFIVPHPGSARSLTACNSQPDGLEIGQGYLSGKISVISNIFRNLSYIPGNEIFIASHHGFIVECVRVLNDRSVDYISDLEDILVVLSNISIYMDMTNFSSNLNQVMLASLLDWAVMEESFGLKLVQNPTLTVGNLVIEIISKLCFHRSNVENMLIMPSLDKIVILCSFLSKMLHSSLELSMIEMSISILYYIVSSDSEFLSAIASETGLISLFISFIQEADDRLRKYDHDMNTELKSIDTKMGMSLDTLRRIGFILSTLAQNSCISHLFMCEEPRLITLAMSKTLDQKVASYVCDALYTSSSHYETNRKVIKWGW